MIIKNNYYSLLTLVLTFLTFSDGAITAQSGNKNKLVNPNIADSKSLQEVEFVSKEFADSLIKGKPYHNIEKLYKNLMSEFNRDQVKKILSQMCIQMNLNKVSEKSLLLIPNLGPKMAHEIEEYRPYVSFKQFRKEIGKYVSKKEVARLEQYFFIPINLNKATDEQILSIPGVGKKLLHEFKEYRPYRSIKQFSKEIGKYVNQNEIKRLERYVTLE
ncbi:helix-hairpin-helix domain-containing protein [bacterium]|jgi:DNA uptake protein ComE-like DNA-binding protein|nr:helix-hairpin-helix domain-containing protein [Verrucomicrobiota bacterium]MDA7682134.1 helix-hairpin-helix domain-containing protein [bacterium]MDB4663204.1 helix-hairpin-helix domain-containing protein [bacterium]MDB4706049.1 helix-hairpin-helix domain-containing protein [Verrucomicrobiota bacterium]